MKCLVFSFFIFCSTLAFGQTTPANILVADTAGMSWLGSATIGGNTYLYITVTGTGPQPAPALGHYYSSDGGAHWSGSPIVPDTLGNNPWGGYDLHSGYAYASFFNDSGSFVARSSDKGKDWSASLYKFPVDMGDAPIPYSSNNCAGRIFKTLQIRAT